MKTTAGIVFLLLAVSSFGYQQDIDHFLLEGKFRYEGFLSGLLDDPDFKVPQQCFSSELTSKFEQVFNSGVKFLFQRDITQVISLYSSASNAIEYFESSCNMKIFFKQFYQLCAYGACNPMNIVINLKKQVKDLTEHIGKHALAAYYIEKTWDEAQYFRLIKDKYRHIGAIVGLAFGEKHDHTLQKQEKQEKEQIGITSKVVNYFKSYVNPDEVKEDYIIIKHFLQGILQGLSEKGNEKKKCYKNLSYMRNDFNTAVDILVKTLEGQNNIAIMSLAATQTYGHLKGIYRDCRLSDFGGKLFKLNEIYENLMQNKEELNAILVNFGMAALTRDFIRAGQLIGNLVKISLDFHVL